MKIKSIRKLSEATEITRSSLRRWQKKDWFPKKGKDGCWDVAEVLAAIEANIRTRSKPVKTGAAVSNNEPVEESIPETDALSILQDSQSDPGTKARALLSLVSVEVAKKSKAGSISRADVDNMKHALEQVRHAEKTYLDIKVRKGELIEREVAKAIIFQLGKRFESVLDVLKISLSSWILDETEDQELLDDFKDEFVKLSRDKMRLETSELEEMITTEEERQGVKK